MKNWKFLASAIVTLLIGLGIGMALRSMVFMEADGTMYLSPGESVLVIAVTPVDTPTSTPSPIPTDTPTPDPSGRDYLVPDSVGTIDGAGNYSQVEPGDRLLIPASRTTKLTVRRIRGTEGEPITIINDGGQVVISDGDWVGIEFVDCQHVRLSGTGSEEEYGFLLRNATNSGVFVRAKSEHIEIDRVEVGPVGGAGIRAYSKLSDVPEGWVQRDMVIHDCYIHGTGLEGMYLGNYEGDTALSDGFHIYNNHLENIGLEGLQFKNASAINVHDNRFLRIGLRWPTAQGRAGIDLQHDHGAEGKVYGNYIEDARRGIELNGAGPTEIYDNVIVACGFRPDGGEGIRWWGGNGMNIHHNEIKNCNEYGIKAEPRSGLIHDNIVCGTASGEHIDAPTVEQEGNVLMEVCD